MKKDNFTVSVEKLVNPIDTGTLHFIQNFTGSLPRPIQNKLISEGAKKTPYMGFIVEPYSYFLNYEIKDVNWAQELLPDGFTLMKTKIYDEDTPKYYGIFGIFNAHTSGFWGLRVEFYLIAKNEATGLLSWIIIDYDTNTISYDPKNGLKSPNANGGIFTIDYDGTLFVDVKRNDKKRHIKLQSNIKNGVMKSLDKRLWVEGNLSIGYGRDISENNPEVFSLKFDPKEFDEALLIDHKDLNIEINNWFEGLFHDTPSNILCFPYAQHYLSDSPGHYSQITGEEMLKEEIKKVDFSKINTFSTKKIGRNIITGLLLSGLMNVLLLTLLILL